jgi:hypothetical protein
VAPNHRRQHHRSTWSVNISRTRTLILAAVAAGAMALSVLGGERVAPRTGKPRRAAMRPARLLFV